nr:MAG TPA: hypothetical protein [Caudoviricetes sp.]
MPSLERNALALAYLPASSALVLHIGLAPLPRRSLRSAAHLPY